MKREVLRQTGGFSNSPAYPRWDVALCLEARAKAGWKAVYNPLARFVQSDVALLETWLEPRESSRAAAYIRSLFPAGDPYFNPNLTHQDGAIYFRSPQRAVPQAPLSAVPDIAAEFDCTSAELEASRAACGAPGSGSVQTITWFLPEFSHAFYGGIHTILRFADYFFKAHAVRSTFVVLPPSEQKPARESIAAAFRELAEACEVRVLRGPSGVFELGPSDVAIASFWKTAFHTLRFNRVRRKFYFLQDDEALFYPAGSTRAVVEATYQFGFPGICNSVGVRNRYIERGGVGEYFDPCVDPAVFNASGRGNRLPVCRVLFCYGRPLHPRNCFELLAAALRILKSRLGRGVRIVAAGADWKPREHGLEGIVENLGLVGYQETAELYRSCHAGVAMMSTCHPSYLPLELMACGTLVISNRNPRNSWLLKDRVNCLLAEHSPSMIADAIQEGLLDDDLRLRLTEEALRLISASYSRWDEQAEKIYRYICRLS
jgi:glycosyltransferase involved in cell wall biosynthesis